MYTRVMRPLLDYLGYGLPRPVLAWDCEWEAQAIIEHGVVAKRALAEAHSAVSPPSETGVTNLARASCRLPQYLLPHIQRQDVWGTRAGNSSNRSSDLLGWGTCKWRTRQLLVMTGGLRLLECVQGFIGLIY
jgi:hypothetical protein